MKKLFYILISISIIIFSCKKASVTESTTSEAGIDTSPPIITLKGLANYTLALEENFVDPGVTAVDDRDGDISNKVLYSAFFNATLTGKYSKEYNIEDAAGNKAETKSRTFLVINTADYLAGNYNATCTCNQYTYGMQYSPVIKTNESFTTSIEPSKNKNNEITIYGVPYMQFQVNYLTVYDINGNNTGSISSDGKLFTIYTSSGYNSIHSVKKDCSYTLKKFN